MMNFNIKAALPIVLATLAGLHSAFAEEAPPTRPNVLFIALDDANDWVGCLNGHPAAKTPNIDRLAATGTLFTRAYCVVPVCNPSRIAVMTGIHPIDSGLYQPAGSWRDRMPSAVSIPQFFREQGYLTFSAGKVFHDPNNKDAEYWDLYLDRPEDPRAPVTPWGGLPSLPVDQFDWGPLNIQDADMPDTEVVDWALERLNEPGGQPIFLACGIRKPHLPWYLPKKYFEAIPLDTIPEPEWDDEDLSDIPRRGQEIAANANIDVILKLAKKKREATQAYLAALNFADAQIGRLLDGLERSPRADNTIVMLWSDHGWQLGDKTHWRKLALWEQATRVPLLVRTPGHEHPGHRHDGPVSLLDMYRTLAELCGLEAPSSVGGYSLVPFLGPTPNTRPQPVITSLNANEHAVRSGVWRYIRYKDGSEELYDLSADPTEECNLAAQPEYLAVSKSLASLLPPLRQARTALPPTENAAETVQFRENQER